MPAALRASGTISGAVLFGVPVRFHFTFLLLLIFLVTAGIGARQSALVDVLYISGLFLSVLLHEFGHALTARFHGIRTLEIVMYPIGGVARLERMAAPRAEFWIALAGPATNVLIAAVLLAGAYLAGEPQANPDRLYGRIATGNIYLAAFNMIPAFPMDGGRVLRALLASWKGDATATRIATAAGRALAVAMGIYGIVSGEMFLVIIAFLIYSAAASASSAVEMGR